MLPPDLSALGPFTLGLIALAFGFSFGFILESAGFGNARKLAAQFYLYDMTVLKVMFTGIVVAMVLIFIDRGMLWLDFEQVFVNPTHLWPQIAGGLLLGVGFLIGGY